VTAAGGTLLELACVGRPALAFVAADDQRSGCRALVDAGCAAGGSDLCELDDRAAAGQLAAFLADRRRRRRLAARARRAVDGRGAGRVLGALRELMSGPAGPIEASE
jgi:spore coat polysaccharide biosynthesis predicted glycosyltransferase SpsG